jgi:aminoglycoside phosphotransferase family enzyme
MTFVIYKTKMSFVFLTNQYALKMKNIGKDIKNL